MTDPLYERVLPVASRLVPEARRQEWMKEWMAELWLLRDQPRRRSGIENSLSLSYGVMADAVWLRLDWLRMVAESARGSASGCLLVLAVYSVLCAGVERVFAGSWWVFWRLVTGHMVGGFAFVGLTGMLAALSRYPLRPLRWDEVSGQRWARARWYLFLGAKVVLTLMLAFFFSMMASAPLRMVVGSRADWMELALWMGLVTCGMRWALLNQEQRCQRCLRMLKEPTRVGMPSRNFLEWSGTELVCEDGHGMLQVAEMTGSWCWYDRWVEAEARWSTLVGL